MSKITRRYEVNGSLTYASYRWLAYLKKSGRWECTLQLSSGAATNSQHVRAGVVTGNRFDSRRSVRLYINSASKTLSYDYANTAAVTTFASKIGSKRTSSDSDLTPDYTKDVSFVYGGVKTDKPVIITFQCTAKTKNTITLQYKVYAPYEGANDSNENNITVVSIYDSSSVTGLPVHTKTQKTRDVTSGEYSGWVEYSGTFVHNVDQYSSHTYQLEVTCPNYTTATSEYIRVKSDPEFFAGYEFIPYSVLIPNSAYESGKIIVDDDRSFPIGTSESGFSYDGQYVQFENTSIETPTINKHKLTYDPEYFDVNTNRIDINGTNKYFILTPKKLGTTSITLTSLDVEESGYNDGRTSGQIQPATVTVPVVIKRAATSFYFDTNEIETGVGGTSYVKWFIEPEGTTDTDLTIVSSDTDVVTINNGVVQAVGTGTATITGTLTRRHKDALVDTISVNVLATEPWKRFKTSGQGYDIDYGSYIGIDFITKSYKDLMYTQDKFVNKYGLTVNALPSIDLSRQHGVQSFRMLDVLNKLNQCFTNIYDACFDENEEIQAALNVHGNGELLADQYDSSGIGGTWSENETASSLELRMLHMYDNMIIIQTFFDAEEASEQQAEEA